MFNEKTINTKHRQAGMTLIELMISIVLGLLLLGAATAMTVSSMVMNGDTLQSARLNQDLDSVMQVMVNDIRRAGYSANFIKGQPGYVFADNEDLNIVSASCILYAYNANGDSVLDSEEKFGFRWDGGADDPIEMGTTVTSCDSDTGWEPLTDTGRITITGLSFDSVNSKCFNFSDLGKNAYWVTPEEGTTKFPCMAVILDIPSEKDKLVNYVSDDNGDFPVLGETGTVSDLLTGDKLIESRQVNVRIMGNLLGNDSSIRKVQSVAINVRNNTIRCIDCS
jgi:prepilin peptidase dependent protein B